MDMTNVLRDAFANARDVLFPQACGLCRVETSASQTLCPDCWAEIVFLDHGGCSKCSRPLPGTDEADPICEECLRHPPVWDRGQAVFQYEGAGRRLVLGLKHGDRLDLAPMLSGWMARAGRDLLARSELIIPVPLHWTRRLKRRTNQSAVLAQRLAGQGPHPARFAPRGLLRMRKTGTQDGKNHEARVRNVEGAMCPGPDARDIAGKRVLLVDDVMTTGATLNAAARICLDAGAASVNILVLALVVRDETSYIAREPEDESDETS